MPDKILDRELKKGSAEMLILALVGAAAPAVLPPHDRRAESAR
jgi:hypothetical protein